MLDWQGGEENWAQNLSDQSNLCHLQKAVKPVYHTDVEFFSISFSAMLRQNHD